MREISMLVVMVAVMINGDMILLLTVTVMAVVCGGRRTRTRTIRGIMVVVVATVCVVCVVCVVCAVGAVGAVGAVVTSSRHKYCAHCHHGEQLTIVVLYYLDLIRRSTEGYNWLTCPNVDVPLSQTGKEGYDTKVSDTVS